MGDEKRKVEFEEKLDEINGLLILFQPKWQLKSIAWMSYEDVSQIIRLHLYKKWHLWKQEKSFRPWCSQVIRNQLRNLVRNHYSRFTRPCLRCEHNLGEDGCNWTTNNIQCSQCPLFAKWERKKEPAFRIRNATSIDYINEHKDLNCAEKEFDYESAKDRLHEKIYEKLDLKRHREIYKYLYVLNWSEETVAKKYKLTLDPTTKKYKQILNLQKKFKDLAKKILEEEEII